MEENRMTGVIIQIMPNKGFMFIRGEDGLSRFVHARDVIPRLAFDTAYEGQKVTFVPDDHGPKGNGLRGLEVECFNSHDH